LEIGGVHGPATSVVGAEGIEAIHIVLGVYRFVGLVHGFDTIEGTQESIMRSRASGSTRDELSYLAIGSRGMGEMILKFCDTAIAYSAMFGTESVHTGNICSVGGFLGVMAIQSFKATICYGLIRTRSTELCDSSSREGRHWGKGADGIRIVLRDKGRSE
jgi:hypothetical protein